MPLRPEYYTLAEAAAIANCTEKLLIHLGVQEVINIYTVPNRRWEFGPMVEQDDSLTPEEKNRYYIEPQLLWIDPQTLLDFEAYPETTEIFAFLCSVSNKHAITPVQTREGSPLKVKYCYLVVRSEDLDELSRLQKKPDNDQALQEIRTDKIHEAIFPPSESGREKQKRATQQRHEIWLNMAKRVKEEHPKWSVSQIAAHVEKEIHGEASQNTIRNMIMGKI